MKVFSKLGINECPICHERTLCVHETEELLYPLDESGSVVRDLICDDSSEYNVNIVCSNCGEQFEALKRGDKWCITDKIKRSADLISFNPFYQKGE